MNKIKKYTLFQSILLALAGILSSIKGERNIKIHFTIASLVILLGLMVSLDRTEWLVIILVIFIILSAEIFNSAIEGICNLLREKLQLDYEETKMIRDISAGAVLLLAIASVIVGLIIFFPHFF